MSEPSGRSASRRPRGRRARIETSAGGVVYRRMGEEPHFLLIRDPYGNWGLPKGHIEAAESPGDAAIREVAEETGLDVVSVVAELPSIDWYFRQGARLIHKYCHFFLMESESGDPCPARDEGITECIWLPFDEAIETITYDNARDVLRAAGDSLGVKR
ncbi:MAG: NUDIX hydrolase [Longimicrobiales bacterium]